MNKEMLILLLAIIAVLSIIKNIVYYLKLRGKNDDIQPHGADGNDMLVSERFRHAMDNMPICIMLISSDRTIEWFNNQFGEKLRVKLSETCGKKVTEVLELKHNMDDLLEPFFVKIKSRADSNISFSNGYMVNKTESNHVLCDGCITGIYDDGGRLQHYFVYFRDTSNEHIQDAIMNMAMSRMDIFTWYYDMDENIMHIDPRYFEYLGISSENYTLTMQEYRNLVHSDDWEPLHAALAQQLQGDLYRDPVPFRLHRGDGTWEWFEGQSNYVGQTEGRPFQLVGICMSIQKFKESERILSEALEKAERSDRLKSVFLANMSHEIRTPLNAIVGFSALLAQEADHADKQEYVKIINYNNELLLRLIGDILDLSKIEAGYMDFINERFDMAALFNDIYSSMKQRIKNPEVILEADNPYKECWVNLDKKRVTQIITNFATNAIKYTLRGHIRMGYGYEDGGIKFYVQDTGIGIADDKKPKVFQRFEKLDSFAQGTGLGLAICKAIVESNDGRIGFDSTEGEGSYFWAWLAVKADIVDY